MTSSTFLKTQVNIKVMKSLGKALILLVLFIGVNWLNSFLDKPKLVVTKQATALNFSKNLYDITSMGNRRLVSSIMWVQTLLESDIDHYKNDDLNSWMFVRFDHITKLEPKFLAAYLFGGQYLSIIKDDDLGAEEIYDRGLVEYPDHYDLNFNAGFHYLFELNKVDKALNSYKKIQYSNEAPSYLPSFVARLERKKGRSLEDVYNILQESYLKSPSDSPQREYLKQQLYSVKAEIDLKCLNSNNADSCSRIDLDGNQYIFQDGKFQAQKAWNPFKFNK